MTFLIAEIGVNHNGVLDIAKEMISQLAGVADAAKFQLSDPVKLHSSNSKLAAYQKNSGVADTALEMSQKLNLTRTQHIELAKYCDGVGIEYMCTGFDLDSVVFLNETVNVTRFKIASGEILSLDVLDYVARQNKQIIMSTGMANYDEIEFAVNYLQIRGANDIVLLYCVSSYPAELDDVNLSSIRQFQKRFDLPIGYSDHTIGRLAALGSVALGCSVIEKHVTLDQGMQGPDHAASVTIDEFRTLQSELRAMKDMVRFRPRVISDSELETKSVARKSLTASIDLPEGTQIVREHIDIKRPGSGISPMEIHDIIGKKTTKFIPKNTLLNRRDICD